MKYLIMVMLLSLSGCGYEAKDSELIGQVKNIISNTPLICPDYKATDISLGVIRNGVGSMSSQDVWLVITSDEQASVLRTANENGHIVKIIYDTKRFVICTNDRFIKKVEIVN